MKVKEGSGKQKKRKKREKKRKETEGKRRTAQDSWLDLGEHEWKWENGKKRRRWKRRTGDKKK